MVVVGVHLFALVQGVLFSRLWGDEAYNLTVSINLAGGHGYASDGLLTTGRYDLFDPRVSTGPTVLIPIAGVIALGVEPVIAGRMVMALFYVSGVTAIGALGWKIARHPGLLIGLVIPLAFDATNPDSPMQSPIDVIGEWPAAGFLALALIFIRRRAWLAGLLMGLAIQAKLVAGISLPVILLMLLLTSESLRQRIWGVFVVGSLAAVPTILFELAKIIQLGPVGYARWYSGFLEFFLLKKIPFIPFDKAKVFLDSWFIPSTAVTLLVLIVGVAVTVIALWSRGFRAALASIRRGSDAWLVVVCGLIGITWTIWWFQSRADFIWIRHLFPGFVPAAAGFLAGAWRAWQGLALSKERLNAIAALIAMSLSVTALSFGIVGRLWYVTHLPIPETIGEQRDVAHVVRSIAGDELIGPWGAIPIAVLAGVHPVPFGVPHEPSTLTLLVQGEEGWDNSSLCGVEVWASIKYRLCAPE
jgi:hypothetical protein